MSKTNMNFGQAIEALKAGMRVARGGWNGKGMWLRLVDPYAPHPDTIAGKTIGIRTNPYFKAADNNSEAEGTMLPWIGMKTADNKFVPWLASQTDMLAEDWAVVDGPAQQAQPAAATLQGRWSLGARDGNLRDIDRTGHGGVLKIVWRMEDDRCPNAALEAQAHAVVAALNAASDKPTLMDYEAEVDKMLAQISLAYTKDGFNAFLTAMMKGIVTAGSYAENKEAAQGLAILLANKVRESIPKAFELVHG